MPAAITAGAGKAMRQDSATQKSPQVTINIVWDILPVGMRQPLFFPPALKLLLHGLIGHRAFGATASVDPDPWGGGCSSNGMRSAGQWRERAVRLTDSVIRA